MIDVVSLPPGNQWDQNQLHRILNNEDWLPVDNYEFKHHENFDMVHGGAIVVIPGRYWFEKVDEINDNIKGRDWVLVIITSDEENVFPVTKVEHPNMRMWVQTPRANADYGNIRLFGDGYSPAFNNISDYSKEASERKLDVFISAQNTHQRRNECFDIVNSIKGDNFYVNETKGFTQGLDPQQYTKLMANAKFAPCPSGAISPDSFRVYEALESGTIPIADDISPVYNSKGYWQKIFARPPFPIIYSWSSLPQLLEEGLPEWDELSNITFAWWQRQKREYAYNIKRDLVALGAKNTRQRKSKKDEITAVVFTSPIPSHPSTDVVEETIANIRHHLPDAEIILLFDGVREEQEHRKSDYFEYVRRMLWKCNNEYKNILPVFFDEHKHQANMMREVMDLIETPTVLFCEGDTPIVPDKDIEWDGIIEAVMSEQADLVRFYPEKHILEPHQHLMLDDPQDMHGVRLQKTVQFSARPHVASKDYYARILHDHFPKNCLTFFEDKMHGVCQQEDWEKNKLWVYVPNEQTQFSYDLDGRAGDQKFEVDFGSR